MASALGHNLLGLRINLFPAFFTNHHMHDLSLPSVGSVGVLDVVDPVELLPPVAPELHQTRKSLAQQQKATKTKPIAKRTLDVIGSHYAKSVKG